MKHLLSVTTLFLAFSLASCGTGSGDTSELVELVEKAVANKAEWQGKEVTVYGYVSAYSPPPNGSDKYLHLRPSPAAVNERPHGLERHVACMVANGNDLEPMRYKYVTVKGKIAEITSMNYLDQKRIVLEPCELVQTK